MAQTHTDTNVNQLVINKMTKQEYDNLSQVSNTELYLVEEQVDSVVTQNSTNPVQSGAVYEALQQSSSNIKEIVDNLIIANNFAYPLEGTYIGQVESTEPPIFYDRKAADFHTFVSQDNGKYFYDDIDNKVYIYIEQPNQHLYCVSDNELYYLENLDTTKTYLSYKTDKLYRTNNGENFNLIATTDYIDLSNKPLSVESSKVKYTLSDGTTKLTLAQESELKTVAFSGSYNDLTDKLQNATTSAAGLMSAEDKVRLGIPNFTNYSSLRSLIQYLIDQGNYFYRFSCSTSNVSTGLPVYTQGDVLFFVEYTCRPSASNAVNITARINGREYNLYVGCFYRNEAAGVEPTWKVLLAQNL